MACKTVIYDFINGTRVPLTTFSRAEAASGEDSRHGLRAIMNPDEGAEALLRDHLRMLSELGRAAAH